LQQQQQLGNSTRASTSSPLLLLRDANPTPLPLPPRRDPNQSASSRQNAGGISPCFAPLARQKKKPVSMYNVRVCASLLVVVVVAVVAIVSSATAIQSHPSIPVCDSQPLPPHLPPPKKTKRKKEIIEAVAGSISNPRPHVSPIPSPVSPPNPIKLNPESPTTSSTCQTSSSWSTPSLPGLKPPAPAQQQHPTTPSSAAQTPHHHPHHRRQKSSWRR
jgi:hypothetical protein